MPNYVVAALYKFVALPDVHALQDPLLAVCLRNEVRGTLLLAPEGINGTVCGTREGIDALLGYLKAMPGMADLEHKESLSHEPPFARIKVRLKREIVSMGVPEVDPNRRVGTYVEPAEWNALLDDPEVVLVDTRNDYEVRVGTFEGAVDPDLDNFRQFPAWAERDLDPKRHRKVAMFCTGGIRCEKASSFLLERGFEEVFHLRGGILKYFEEVAQSESKWRGECFVFDQRVTVDHALEPGEHILCFGCRHPVSPEQTQSSYFEEGVCCPDCHAGVDEQTRRSRRERHRQVTLAAARGQAHLGDAHPAAPARRPAACEESDAKS